MLHELCRYEMDYFFEAEVIFENSVRTVKKTLRFTVTKMNWLKLLIEIIDVFTESHTKQINTKCRFTNRYSWWYIVA